MAVKAKNSNALIGHVEGSVNDAHGTMPVPLLQKDDHPVPCFMTCGVHIVLHTLECSMSVPLPLDKVFPFFADATNLQQITPPELDFHMVTPQPIHMAEGTLIEYRLRLFRVHFSWLTRIAKWNPPHEFVDEQLKGPYKQWIHTHRFQEHGGQTVIDDTVQYRLPLFPLGEAAFPLVRWQLGQIFAYRQRAVRRALTGEH